MPASDPAPKRVAILGGGMAALTAAYELAKLNVPGQAPRYKITIYQQGWRLGGKGASGRNAKCNGRIEEHGLHIWFGAYENAFRTMTEVYARVPGKWPHGAVTTAFREQHGFHLMEDRPEGWKTWHFPIPPLPGLVPGDRNPQGDCRPRNALIELGVWLAKYYSTRLYHHLLLAAGPAILFDRESLIHTLNPAHLVELAQLSASVALADDVEARRRLAREYDEFIRRLSQQSTILLENPGPLALLEGWSPDFMRRAIVVVTVVAAVVSGTLTSQAYEDNDWDRLNGFDLREWIGEKLDDLPMPGDRRRYAESELITASYDLFFSYLNGDETQGKMEAGTALRAAIWLLLEYKGAFMWRMNRGMGDAIFAPLYHALDGLHVELRFFHKVRALVPSRDGSRIESVAIERQASVKADAKYSPLPPRWDGECWPTEPDFDQLDQGERLKGDWGRFNLESDWSEWDSGIEPLTLRAGPGAGADVFDHVILGIPLGALPPICPEFTKPGFRTMLERVKTVQTQAVQLWLDKSLDDLCDRPPFTGHPVLTTFQNPIDTYSDMSYLIECEDWPAQARPKHLAYFCGVLSEPAPTGARRPDPNLPRDSSARVLAYFQKMLVPDQPGNPGPRKPPALWFLWPRAFTGGGATFDWERLCGSAAAGEARLKDQYRRANIDGSERYVIALPGTSMHRLRAHQSGYGNLTLTGDWIYNGLFLGCVEGAVISGKQAARAVSGEPIEVVGEGNLFNRP